MSKQCPQPFRANLPSSTSSIKIGNIKDFIKEFEQNTAGIQKWKMVTYKLGRYCMRVFWPSLVRFGEIQ